MNQLVKERTETGSPGQAGDVVAEAIAYTKKAQELRGVAIEKLLEQREKIEQDLKTLGYVPKPPSGNGVVRNTQKETKRADSQITEQPHVLHQKRFKDLTLAAIGRVLLGEHETLHGKEIERLAKAGGFKGGAKNFQNYMPVAFKRAGGFENIGGNTWKLKEST
jgi:hypothetical protein